MYWHNPIHEITLPSDTDIIVDSHHGGEHCLFYTPTIPVVKIAKQTRLQDLCDWANNQIDTHGRHSFAVDHSSHYDAANLIKINQMVHSIAQHGSVKPMLLHFQGSLPYTTGTGDTRLRAIERLPHINTVSAFVSTHSQYREQFSQYQEIHNLQDFVECFGTKPAQLLIRLTDAQAPYGIDWYEYVLDDPATNVPGWDFCLRAIQNYINAQPVDFRFGPQWFDQRIDWAAHAGDR